MVDPIKPFTTLIDSLARRKAEAPDRAARATRADSYSPPQRHAPPPADLRARLRSRLRELNGVDPDRARRTFVETILAWQLGEEVANDPEFVDLVAKVSDRLHSDAQLDDRLAKLIARLVA